MNITKSLIAVLLTLTCAAALAAQKKQEDEEKCKLPKIRDELAERVKKDQAARKAIPYDVNPKGAEKKWQQDLIDKVVEIDKDNTAWLKQQVKKHGWLGKTLVGTKGAKNAWLLVQHADRDRKFQQHCLDLMNKMDPGEVSRRNIAYLTDRVLVGQKKPQRYGTQVIFKDGKAQVKTVEDPENLNKRRKAMDMEPIEKYLASVEKSISNLREEQNKKKK